jgi:hypothetical protein
MSWFELKPIIIKLKFNLCVNSFDYYFFHELTKSLSIIRDKDEQSDSIAYQIHSALYGDIGTILVFQFSTELIKVVFEQNLSILYEVEKFYNYNLESELIEYLDDQIRFSTEEFSDYISYIDFISYCKNNTMTELQKRRKWYEVVECCERIILYKRNRTMCTVRSDLEKALNIIVDIDNIELKNNESSSHSGKISTNYSQTIQSLYISETGRTIPENDLDLLLAWRNLSAPLIERELGIPQKTTYEKVTHYRDILGEKMVRGNKRNNRH